MKRFLPVLLLALSLAFAAPAVAQDPAPVVAEAAEVEADNPEETAEKEAEEAVDKEAKKEADKEEAKEAAKDLGIEAPEGTLEGNYLTWMVQAVKHKNWPLLAGLIIMLLLFLANKLGLKDRVPKTYIPWIGVLISVLGSIGTMLVTGFEWHEAIIQGFLVGAAASGLWELLKNQLNKWKKAEDVKEEPKEEDPAPEPEPEKEEDPAPEKEKEDPASDEEASEEPALEG